MAARTGLNLNSLYLNENDKTDHSPKMKKKGGGGRGGRRWGEINPQRPSRRHLVMHNSCLLKTWQFCDD